MASISGMTPSLSMQEQEQEQEQVSGRVEEVFLPKYWPSPLAGVGRQCMRHPPNSNLASQSKGTYNTVCSLGIIRTVCSLGNIWHRMFPREHMAPYAPLFGTVCSLVQNCMFPREHTAPYASLFGTVCSFVRHRILPCSAPYAPMLGTE